jgi:hypothetical protein
MPARTGRAPALTARTRAHTTITLRPTLPVRPGTLDRLGRRRGRHTLAFPPDDKLLSRLRSPAATRASFSATFAAAWRFASRPGPTMKARERQMLGVGTPERRPSLPIWPKTTPEALPSKALSLLEGPRGPPLAQPRATFARAFSMPSPLRSPQDNLAWACLPR